MTPYYSDDYVTLYHGDCREGEDNEHPWLDADVMVTDPPYGRAWKQGEAGVSRGWSSDAHPGIAGDKDTTTRDEALALWNRPAIVFGDLMLPPPVGTKQVLIFRKSSLMGTKGTFLNFRRDVEAIYLVGQWPAGLGGACSVLTSNALGNQVQKNGQHPHAKPLDVMETLLARTQGTIADPFAGSGSTLVAAKQLGRKSIGVELDERFCEIAARRLAQDTLFGASA